MKELEREAIKELISFYENFIHSNNKELIKQKAKELYNATPSTTLVRESIINAFGNLFPLGYPNVNSGLKPLTKEEAKQILEKLKKLQKELEK